MAQSIPRVLGAWCVALLLLQSSCSATFHDLFPYGAASSRPTRGPSRQELHAWRIDAALRPFVWGASCSCANATCSATAAARAWCVGRPPECFDELLMHAPRGHVTLLANPLRFERVDVVLLADGQTRAFLRNQVRVVAERKKEVLVLTPIGADAGQRPLQGAIEIAKAKEEDYVSIDGTEYTCAEAHDNLTGLSNEAPREPVTKGRKGRW